MGRGSHLGSGAEITDQDELLRPRQVSYRMRQTWGEFRDAQDAGDGGLSVVGGDIRGEDASETREERSAVLEAENRELRETVQAQADELDALRRQVSELEEEGQEPGGADAVDGGRGQPGDWSPPERGSGLPDAGVVTLGESPTRNRLSGRRSRWWPSGG